MKQFLISTAVLLAIFSAPVHAKPVCKNETIEQSVKAIAETFEAKTLGSLDADKPYTG